MKNAVYHLIDSVLLCLAAVNDLDGASCHTFAAVYAFFVIDRGVEILYLYRAGGTLFLAHLAADTAVLAGELSCLAVVAGRAEHVDML